MYLLINEVWEASTLPVQQSRGFHFQRGLSSFRKSPLALEEETMYVRVYTEITTLE